MSRSTDVSRVASGSVTSAGALGVIAAITAPPDGLYNVTLQILLTGTAETALRNLRLRENGNTVVDNIPSVSASGGWQVLNYTNVEVNQGGGNLDVVAIVAAVVGSVYNVVLIADRVE